MLLFKMAMPTTAEEISNMRHPLLIFKSCLRTPYTTHLIPSIPSCIVAIKGLLLPHQDSSGQHLAWRYVDLTASAACQRTAPAHVTCLCLFFAEDKSLADLALGGDDPLYSLQTQLWFFPMRLHTWLEYGWALVGIVHFDGLLQEFLVFANTEFMLRDRGPLLFPTVAHSVYYYKIEIHTVSKRYHSKES